MLRHLAQLNTATLRHPIDDPRIADFADALPAVNGAGEGSPGYVWRLQSAGGDATDIQVFDDPLVIVNLTVWESLEALKTFAYHGIHRDFFRRRAEWFVAGSTRTALWWLPAGTLPTTEDAKRRLEFIDMFGTSPYAFTMGQSPGALAIERISLDDTRTDEFGKYLADDVPCGDEGCLVAAELDDVFVACGAARWLDDTTAEIRRVYVAQSARGLRVGASIIAELQAAARVKGLHHVVLETWPRQVSALETFGFRQCPDSDDRSESVHSIWMEKTLSA